MITDQTQGGSLINSLLSEKDSGVMKYDAVGWYRVTFKAGLYGVSLDAADEVLFLGLEEGKVFNIPDQGSCFTRLKSFTDKRPFWTFSVGYHD